MAVELVLELHIAGPELERVLQLKAGEPECVLGRDTACSVQLPDAQQNVSRRHLAVWNEAGELHFEVLSSTNGVQMPFGEAPPGAHGVLRPPGEVMLLADYQCRWCGSARRSNQVWIPGQSLTSRMAPAPSRCPAA